MTMFRIKGRPIAACLLLAGAATAAAQPAGLRSGVYEGMMLAVAPDGAVTGVFGQERGTAVTRSCAFTIGGVRDRTGAAAIRAWTQGGGTMLRGTMRSTVDGIRLDLPGVHDIPGCGDVLPPVRPNVVELDRTGAGDWSGLVRIIRAKTVLRPTAIGPAGKGPYVVAGDVVGVLARRGAMIRVAYPSPEGRESRGWIAAGDATSIARN